MMPSFHPPTKNMLCNRHMLTVAGPFHSQVATGEKRSKKHASWAPLPPPPRHGSESIHPSISWRRQPHMGSDSVPQRTRLMPKLSLPLQDAVRRRSARARTITPKRALVPVPVVRGAVGTRAPIRGLARTRDDGGRTPWKRPRPRPARRLRDDDPRFEKPPLRERASPRGTPTIHPRSGGRTGTATPAAARAPPTPTSRPAAADYYPGSPRAPPPLRPPVRPPVPVPARFGFRLRPIKQRAGLPHQKRDLRWRRAIGRPPSRALPPPQGAKPSAARPLRRNSLDFSGCHARHGPPGCGLSATRLATFLPDER
jgi:hypothetical protein